MSGGEGTPEKNEFGASTEGAFGAVGMVFGIDATGLGAFERYCESIESSALM